MKIIVIGAGLAGSACAHALATRGCNVTVLEASEPAAPGSAASPSSGLPAALMAPHHGAASNPITQLSHLGIAATEQAARTLLVEGRDWQHCGALQRAGKLGPQAHWFSDAAWVKPAALVAAWLAHPRITLLQCKAVNSLQRCSSAADPWQAVDAQGHVLAQAENVVVANAYQAKHLLSHLHHSLNHNPHANLQQVADALHQVAGQVVYGPWTAGWQALWPTLLPELAAQRAANRASQAADALNVCAVNGNGHFIPAIPWQGSAGDSTSIWLSGSTYEHDTPQNQVPGSAHLRPAAPLVTAQGLAANLQRLQQLLPAAAQLLAAQHNAGLLRGWAGVRCTTRDRLPVVGALAQMQGVYVCTAMGSRGLSFSALCGQHVAALVTKNTSQCLPEFLASALGTTRFSHIVR